MKTITFLMLTLLLISCSDGQLKKPEEKNVERTTGLTISVVDAQFPLRLAELQLNSKANAIRIDKAVHSQIEQTVNDYYKNECAVTDLNEYKNYYITTLRFQDRLQTVFLVLLKHYPNGVVNSKLLVYDNTKKTFIGKPVDFNLHALYDYENGKLVPTDLKTAFKIDTPEIELVDFDKDGITDFKCTRLAHNGTANALQTTILSTKNAKIDTLYFNEKSL